MAGKPKPGFYIAVFLVVAGLVGIGIWRFAGGKKDKSKQADMQLPAATLAEDETGGAAGVTTVSEYEYEPAAKLPPVKGASNYKKIGKTRTVKFAINVWAGWAPIFYANEGKKAGKLWKTPSGKDFKVDLVLIDDPVQMRQAYVSGNVHIGWATVDMLPLLLEGMKKDSRVKPRVFQQIDWSNGGDGIVVRDSIKTIGDLRGKKIVLAQNSPSQFFILNALLNAGVQPKEVDFKFTKDAFQAAAAYRADKSISACVSWAPDIYNLTEKVKGNKLLLTTGTANKLIADVWFARADFAKDHPDIIEGLVRGIFDAMVELEAEAAKTKVAKWMADGYGLPVEETSGMLADAHWTNYAENKEFFLAANNPTNFERTFKTAYYLYQQLPDEVVSKPFVSFDSVVDFSVIKKLAKDPKYANQKNTYNVKFQSASADTIQAESSEILTKTVVIHFYPNSSNIHHVVIEKQGGKDTEVAYDPNVPFILEEIGKLAGQYGAAQIVIEGHTDASMKGRGVSDEMVKTLSRKRAESVKKGVALKFPDLDPNQFAVTGVGWAKPKQAGNHAQNRRVEVKVYPLESGGQ